MWDEGIASRPPFELFEGSKSLKRSTSFSLNKPLKRPSEVMHD